MFADIKIADHFKTTVEAIEFDELCANRPVPYGNDSYYYLWMVKVRGNWFDVRTDAFTGNILRSVPST